MDSCLIFLSAIVACWIFIWVCTGDKLFSRPIDKRKKDKLSPYEDPDYGHDEDDDWGDD